MAGRADDRGVQQTWPPTSFSAASAPTGSRRCGGLGGARSAAPTPARDRGSGGPGTPAWTTPSRRRTWARLLSAPGYRSARRTGGDPADARHAGPAQERREGPRRRAARRYPGGVQERLGRRSAARGRQSCTRPTLSRTSSWSARTTAAGRRPSGRTVGTGPAGWSRRSRRGPGKRRPGAGILPPAPTMPE